MNNIEVFNGIKDNSKEKLKNILKERKLSKKEILFNEKDYIDKVYFLKTGKISIFKMNENGERKVIFILRNGEMINEISFDNSKATTVGCEAFDKSIVLECRVDDFVKIMEEDFILTKNVLIHTQNTNRRLYRQLKN